MKTTLTVMLLIAVLLYSNQSWPLTNCEKLDQMNIKYRPKDDTCPPRVLSCAEGIFIETEDNNLPVGLPDEGKFIWSFTKGYWDWTGYVLSLTYRCLTETRIKSSKESVVKEGK